MSKWVNNVNNLIKKFADKHSSVYAKSEREISASFEIGCFLSLVDYYEDKGCILSLKNLDNNEFRYLTTPSGNPDNFSYVNVKKGKSQFEIRQQVRIVSHIDTNISFTPDIVVLKSKSNIKDNRREDYYSGKRSFFYVESKEVIAAHECKSMTPFPELLVSFLGVLLAAHSWYDEYNESLENKGQGLHLAPTLFVGGSARSIHLKMIESMKDKFPINIIVGIHNGNWDFSELDDITLIDDRVIFAS